jgi:hypothetical protein
MDALAGYTGFVGSNIADKHRFDNLYNSGNIESAFGTRPDLLVYSGVPAEMFLANTNPAADLAAIENAVENIRKIAPKRLVLISTIAVLDNPVGADEDSIVETDKLTAYGRHRYQLEQTARRIVPDCHIIRLPALFGKNLKKNFIYDIICFFPQMLNKAKFDDFSAIEPLIAECYKLRENGFYKLQVQDSQRDELHATFERLRFSASNFTDSRSVYQFYNLAHLWEHIGIVLDNNIPLLHLAAPPLSAADVYRETSGGEFVNEISATPYYYDYRTKYAELFGGHGSYIFCKEQVLSEIKEFVK